MLISEHNSTTHSPSKLKEGIRSFMINFDTTVLTRLKPKRLGEKIQKKLHKRKQM